MACPETLERFVLIRKAGVVLGKRLVAYSLIPMHPGVIYFALVTTRNEEKCEGKDQYTFV